MKKIILLIMYILMSINTAMAEDERDYVIVELGGAFKEGGINSVTLRDSSDYRRNNSIDIKYYTKDECEKDIYAYVKNQKHDDNVIIGGKTYTYEFYPELFNVYLCIKKDIWEQIAFDKFFIDLHKEMNNYIPGDEILYKNLNDFTEKMKSCGITQFNGMHLPIPETPLICDKYSEENPIPVVESDDFWDIKKEVSQNKREFDEVLREFLKKRK